MKAFAVLAFFLVAAASAEPEIRCPSDGGVEKLLPHKDCNKYYQCTNGVAVIQICPSGLLWNIELNTCDWQSNVDCRGRVLPEEEENVIEIEFLPNGCPVDPKLKWSLPDERDCNKYWVCRSGRKIAHACGRNFLFNSATQACDWPKNVDCKRKPGNW